ncbi:VOC family protein [Scytonema sp. NUACC26]|uniref:VOC family protein n=1 Tax=Scytonema sp. NUACC26 TaxID=3140176 RepID=UPI0034DC1D5F
MLTSSPQVSVNSFILEVDHIFVCTTKYVAEALVLQELGLHCSSCLVRRVEQGTASRIIFFENTYLELIWVEDERAFERHFGCNGIHTLARFDWQRTGASPFGFGLRSKFRTAKSPLSFRQRRIENTRSDLSVRFATPNVVSLEEPICFVIPNSIALTTWFNASLPEHQQLISHPLGVNKLTGVKVTVSSDRSLSRAISLLCLHGIVTIEKGTSPLLELTFDSEIRGKILDARPILPILLKY